MKDELIKELKKRGTAEIINGEVFQVTQALDEKENEATYLMFGELRKDEIIPIDEACAKCDSWKGRFASTKPCQEYQSKDARARGFSQVICPHQFKG